MTRTLLASAVLTAALSGCKCGSDDPAPAEEPSVILGVEQTATTSLPGLNQDVEVLYNEFGVPHIFGHDDADVARVHGYLIARDRFFFLDLSRRLGLGTVSELVGQDGLDTDIESRQRGQVAVADALFAELDKAPRQAAYIDAYAEGINAFIDAANAGTEAVPAEVVLLAPLLGLSESEAMQPYTRRDVIGAMAFTVFELAWERGDIGRAADDLRLETLFDGADLETLRKAGMREDVFDRVVPARDNAAAVDWTPGGSTPMAMSGGGQPGPRVPLDVLERLDSALERAVRRRGKDRDQGYGSNAWAVHGDHTASGNAILAGDPHLPLQIPSIIWALGLDTRELGGGDMHVVGGQYTPFAFVGVGTNGDLAWGQTNAGGNDITDWYAERIELDASGAPATSLFQGSQQPLTAVAEEYVIADVPLLGSTGRTELITRYETFDGRWIQDIEGREVGGPGDAGAGETAVNLFGKWIIPEDLDGVDGITAVSFDYTGFDAHAMVRAVDEMQRAKSIEEYVEISKDFVAYGLQVVVADKSGSILYSPYMAMPCRDNLPRNPDGSFAAGSDPKKLIDGTQYGGFEIPADADGHVDFEQTGDKCLVAWAEQPWSRDPAQGFLAAANGDPGGFALDDDLYNDGAYIGGPWLEGFRQAEISEELGKLVARGDVTVADMQAIQSNHTSVIGKFALDMMIEAIDEAAAAGQGTSPADVRLAALYAANQARIDEVRTRLVAWADRGYQAQTGVETFYDGAPSAEDKDDAVATMIFNAWYWRVQGMALGDEGMPSGDSKTLGIMRMLMESRGDPSFASYNPATDESVYWDILGTPEVETSEEVAILALIDGLDFLQAPPTGDAEGGFGTADMDQWLWGERHLITFEPMLIELLGEDFAFLVEDFRITPESYPGEGLPDLPGFPRHGDNKNIDAGNISQSGASFDNSYGAVARMVFEVGPNGSTGVNLIAGGQNADPASAHFDDQARLWLANEAWPVSTIPAEIVKYSVGRETFTK